MKNNINLSKNKIHMKAAIFDLDGTLIDSMNLHYEIVSTIFTNFNKTISKKKFQNYAGAPFETIAQDVLGNIDIKNINNIKKNLLDKNFQKIKLMSGAIELLELLKKNQYKIAIASGSPVDFIEKSLQEFNIKQYFDYYVSGEQVKNPKPAPDVFLDAAKKLKIQPKNCIVIEDGIGGINAAKSIGMKTIGIGTNLPADVKVSALKNLKISDF